MPGLPRPPANALPFVNGTPTPIFYNQPVVLQCVSTAVVSPVMIIRQVEKTSTVIGGGSSDLHPAGSTFSRLPCAPGESLGDSVGQLQKVAFELVSDPIAAFNSPPPTEPLAGFAGGGMFLACLGDTVGIHRPEGVRHALSLPGLSTPSLTPTTATSVGTSAGSASTPGLPGEVDYQPQVSYGIPATASARQNLYGRARSNSASISFESSDGGKVKRARRVSSSTALVDQPGAQTGRRRGASLSVVGPGPANAAYFALTGHLPQHELTPPVVSNEWQMDCGEPSVWTIASMGKLLDPCLSVFG